MSTDDADVVDCRMKWQAAAAVLLVIIVASESFLIPEFNFTCVRNTENNEARIRQSRRAVSKVSTVSATAKPRISSVCDLLGLRFINSPT